MDDSLTANMPLCMDMDGTLVRTDLLLESALALLKRNPLYLILLPWWLMRGRAHLKREMALRAKIDVATLPYDPRMLELLRDPQRRQPVLLCTASDQALADAVAAHLGGFEGVLASDGTRNLSGRRKAEALVDAYGDRGFDYAGNEARDLAIWRHARRAFVVNASKAVAVRAGTVSEIAGVFPREPTGWRTWLQALRVYQWIKNILVFVPLLAAHLVLDPTAVARSIGAFATFCLCASGVYVLNDLLDLGADRRHPRKCRRPFASGRLPLIAGIVAAPVLTAIAFIAACLLAPRFALVLLGYYVLTLAYSFKLKQIAMLDVLVLAALYTLRIIGGTVAIGVGSSFWLLAFSMFLFLSLAILKRYTELNALRENAERAANGRGYGVDDLTLLQSLGAASGYLSVLVLALYINSTASAALYHRPQFLWLLCPLLLYWISRAWIVAHRGAMYDDPVVFAARDRISLMTLALCGLAVVAAIL